MTTIEMRPAGRGSFGNGLITRGFVRRTIRHAHTPESGLRGWSFGLGCGFTGMTGHSGWILPDCALAGGEW
ncbi:MAG: hypothetical protein H7834_01740 [Magnetococcus sp. YQC-9]